MNLSSWARLAFLPLLLSPAFASEPDQGRRIERLPATLSVRDRIEPSNRMLQERLDTLLPRLMRETGLDMWLVLTREYAEDPVYLTLVPEPAFSARRLTMLVFHDRGPQEGVERLTVSRYGGGEVYQSVWEGGTDQDQWKRLAELIAEAFSNEVITPGVTTTDDVAWYIRQRFEELDLRVWFQPYVNFQRREEVYERDDPFYGVSEGVIRRGDVLHTDVGICYLRLCSDTQEMGYVVRNGESAAPADAEGILSTVYSHPLGFFGHGPGPTIGMWDEQGPTPVRGAWKLHANTAYAIEGNVKVQLAEWDDGWVQIKLEQSAYFDGKRVIYLAGRQTDWHLVR